MAILTEHITFERSLTDRENCRINGVKLCGLQSRNGYRYSEAALKKAVPLYENAKVYADHPATQPHGKSRTPRSVREIFGRVVNPRYESGKGVYGDIEYLKSYASADHLVEMADRMPEVFGMSHVADGDVNKGEVTEIKEVFSVDFVDRPATNENLRESQGNKKMAQKTIRQILTEAPAKDVNRRVLLEMEDMGMAMPDATVETPEGDGVDPVKSAVDSIVSRLFADADNAIRAKVLKALGIENALVPKGKTDTATTPATDAPVTEGVSKEEDAMTEEDTKRLEKANLTEAENMLLRAGRDATDEQIAAVAAVAPEKRKALVESWPAAKSTSGTVGAKRPVASPGKTLTESEGDESMSEYEREKLALKA